MNMTQDQLNRRVFDTAFELWMSRSKINESRQRLKRYTYGDQWGDIVNVDGVRMKERDWIEGSGRKPITNNLIRRLVKAIVGRYRNMSEQNRWYGENGDPEEGLLLEELDSRLLEEFLISGMAIQRVADDNPFDRGHCEVKNVNPEAFFCNDFQDPRGRDIEIAGMLHDMSPAEVLIRFGSRVKGSGKNALDEVRRQIDSEALPVSGNSMQFFTAPRGRLRVIEVWTREFTARGGVKWRARWFTSSGILLDSYLSPWRHSSHPFVIKFYPLIDGEIHSFVEDLIDQQYYINRIIVLIDKIMTTSSKGVLLFPLHHLPKGMNMDEVGRRWARPDGIIPLAGRDEVMPRQVGGNNCDAAAYRLLEMELKLFDQTSGVGSALLGGTGPGSNGVSGVEHYQAQIENATIALADIFRTFRSHISQRDNKFSNLKRVQPWKPE